jgi:hypothetical protein
VLDLVKPVWARPEPWLASCGVIAPPTIRHSTWTALLDGQPLLLDGSSDPFLTAANYALIFPRNPTLPPRSGRNVMPAASSAATILATASSRASERHCSVETTRVRGRRAERRRAHPLAFRNPPSPARILGRVRAAVRQSHSDLSVSRHIGSSPSRFVAFGLCIRKFRSRRQGFERRMACGSYEN